MTLIPVISVPIFAYAEKGKAIQQRYDLGIRSYRASHVGHGCEDRDR